VFELLLWITAGVTILAIAIAFDGSRDVFHPMVYIGAMFLFLYSYMPLKLFYSGQLSTYFTEAQLISIQILNLAGVLAFATGCLLAGVRLPRRSLATATTPNTERRLVTGGAIAGGLGLMCWVISIANVGGFVNAFSHSYGGGWDDSGYVRDGSILLLAGVVLLHAAIAAGRPRLISVLLLITFGTPWFVQALLTSRRGPTFTFCVVAIASWFLYRNRRPPVLLTALSGLVLGYFIMFLVANRSNIHLGSDMDFNGDVSAVAETSDTGNEFVYGTGAVMSAKRTGHYYWGRRYLAQVAVRPIPSSIWPTKYVDFGVPELLQNAGTGEGFGDALGWVGAPGSAPGIVSDLWLEFWWLSVPVLGLIGFGYGWLWRRAVLEGGPWTTQYAVFFALSIYLVMQTMEAVIFRSVVLSIPIWLTWNWALRRSVPKAALRVHGMGVA
jgi:hypothetical protein